MLLNSKRRKLARRQVALNNLANQSWEGSRAWARAIEQEVSKDELAKIEKRWYTRVAEEKALLESRV